MRVERALPNEQVSILGPRQCYAGAPKINTCVRCIGFMVYWVGGILGLVRALPREKVSVLGPRPRDPDAPTVDSYLKVPRSTVYWV